MRFSVGAVVLAALSITTQACGGGDEAAPPPKVAKKVEVSSALPETTGESHLADVRQLTFGGENAEAYWSFAGDQLILQARSGDQACDRIYRMKVNEPKPSFTPVSNGKGATTCS